MTWSYRLILNEEDPDNPCYAMHEVFYNDEGKPTSWTSSPVEVILEVDGYANEAVRMFRDILLRPPLRVKNGKLKPIKE